MQVNDIMTQYVEVTSSSVSIVVCQNRVAQLSGTSDIG